jgi:hypothetical protein
MKRLSQACIHVALSLAVVALAGCGPKDLPDDQLLTSAHFRYHARADTVLDPTILDRLEAYRTEFDTAYGVESGVVDYYRYRDWADFAANSGCPVPCTDGRTVLTVAPLLEHELIHALMADVGQPAHVLQEGVAQYAACIQPNLAWPVDPATWAGAVEAGGYGDYYSNGVTLYNFGQRLVAWMRTQGPSARFVDFYRSGISTSDPALFDVQFQRAWGRRLSDVAVEINVDRYAGSFCPCTAPALAANGGATSFVSGQEYRTFDVAMESRVELANEGRQQVFPSLCENSGALRLATLPDSSGPTRTIARMTAGRYGVVTGASETRTATVRQTQTPQDDWSCEAALAAPIHVGAEEVALWVTADRASIATVPSDMTWFALDLDGPRIVSLLALGTRMFCDDGCASFGAEPCSQALGDQGVTVFPPPAGPLLIGVGRSSEPVGPGSVGVLVRTPP